MIARIWTVGNTILLQAVLTAWYLKETIIALKMKKKKEKKENPSIVTNIELPLPRAGILLIRCTRICFYESGEVLNHQMVLSKINPQLTLIH